ncbi:MAG: putative nucleic-acid-binding protein contains domain [Myxococcales bacterium]|nr:putative nucleic-acid-binding protein contains domain [Myxococcales bacterium]
MIAIDTNVLVRLLVNDDPVQSAKAARLFSSDDVLIPKTVLLETEWVLRFSYAVAPAVIGGAFERLLAAPSVTVEDATAVRAAVDAHGAGVDFADALHVASAASATKLLTFDKKLVRQAKRQKSLVPVDLIG